MDLLKAIQKYGGGPVITWKDERFQKWGIHAFMTNELPEQGIKVDEWNHSNGEVNIQIAEKANIGIVISEYTLAESGTIVIFSDKDKGRMVSFFPKHLIALIPKSSLVPRFTQAAEKLRERFKTMLDIPSSIHFISGPSNSADIELELVVESMVH